MKTGLIASIALLLASPSARADTFEIIILHLSTGASCRAADGQKRDPPVVPEREAGAHRAANGMIETDARIEGGDCYFFRSEAKLVRVKLCPPGSVGGEEQNFAGIVAARDTIHAGSASGGVDEGKIAGLSAAVSGGEIAGTTLEGKIDAPSAAVGGGGKIAGTTLGGKNCVNK